MTTRCGQILSLAKSKAALHCAFMATSNAFNHNEIAASLGMLAPRLMEGAALSGAPQRLTAGASQETWAFAVESAGRKTQMILRRRGPVTDGQSAAVLLASEAAVLSAAVKAGVKAPQVHHVCIPEDGLGEAYVMEALVGETIGVKILRDPALTHARSLLAGQLGQALASIHATPVPETAGLETSNGSDQVHRYRELYDQLTADDPATRRPVMELTFAWLAQNPPTALPTCLVHGDFRLGNFMVDQAGLVGVLDWELCHIGDPREDIGWICVNSWRFGQPQNQVGGFGALSALLNAYQEAGGQQFELGEIAWFQLLGSLKWGVMCLIMHQAFASGADAGIERGMIGRRASEAEIDMLDLLDQLA
jgi:aminoglycoside phosphotransferase (APT) family kinase protein